MNSIPPDWDFEVRALRAAAEQAGIQGSIRPSDVGVELESADELITRLKAANSLRDELTQRRSRRRRLVLIASSVAAAGVLVTGVIQPWGSTPVQAATPAVLDYQFAAADTISIAPGKSPANALQRLSDAAQNLRTPSKTIGTQYVLTDNWYANSDTETERAALIPQITETWLTPDGSRRLVERRGQPIAPDGRGLAADGPWNEQPATADEAEPAGFFDADLAASLPTDPDALRNELMELADCLETDPGTSRSFCLYRQILMLHEIYVVSPQLDAAIWEMLRDEQGFRLLGKVKDRAGRVGVGISIIDDASPEFRQVLIADPKTGRLLGSEQILIAPVEGNVLEAPAIMSFTAILESKYID